MENLRKKENKVLCNYISIKLGEKEIKTQSVRKEKEVMKSSFGKI